MKRSDLKIREIILFFMAVFAITGFISNVAFVKQVQIVAGEKITRTNISLAEFMNPQSLLDSLTQTAISLGILIGVFGVLALLDLSIVKIQAIKVKK